MDFESPGSRQGGEASDKKGFLERVGIVRHIMKKDLLCFFLPWITVFFLELFFCTRYGDGFTDIWRVVRDLIGNPQHLLILPLHRSIGLALIFIGLTIMIVSQVTLWKNYSGFVVIKKGHRLITHGIYRFTRNPIYLGALMVFTGLPVYSASLYGLSTMVILVPIFLFRIKMEEALLSEHFGDEYEAYRKVTRKLIPFLY